MFIPCAVVSYPGKCLEKFDEKLHELVNLYCSPFCYDGYSLACYRDSFKLVVETIFIFLNSNVELFKTIVHYFFRGSLAKKELKSVVRDFLLERV